MYKDKTSWKLTAPTIAISILHTVKESPGAFGPLKSVAANLCLILDNCEVWPPTHTFNLKYSKSFQQTEVDRQAIELLAPRVKVLSESLNTPICSSDVNEKRRGSKLER